MIPRDQLYLDHMNECITRILDYAVGGRNAFMKSTLIQDGIIRNLQVMAESSQRVSDELKAKHPEIDWRAMAGFRNVLVHDYLNIELDIVWNVVMKDLADLKPKIEALLGEFQDND